MNWQDRAECAKPNVDPRELPNPTAAGSRLVVANPKTGSGGVLVSEGEAAAVASPLPTFPDDAACAGEDVALFYSEQQDGGRSSRIARAICGGCPVRTECLEAALARNEGWGIWGGYTADERAVLRKYNRMVPA